MSEIRSELPENLSGAIHFTLPAGMMFDDLCLQVTEDKRVSLNWDVLHAICATSGVDESVLVNRPLVLVFLLNAWLLYHRHRGWLNEEMAPGWQAIVRMLERAALEELGPVDPDNLPQCVVALAQARPSTKH